jgi:hypothetical protein
VKEVVDLPRPRRFKIIELGAPITKSRQELDALLRRALLSHKVKDDLRRIFGKEEPDLGRGLTYLLRLKLEEMKECRRILQIHFRKDPGTRRQVLDTLDSAINETEKKQQRTEKENRQLGVGTLLGE